jgi:uncharacterized protein YcbK (DUF882 family)
MQLTKNFHLNEVFDWAKHQAMKPSDQKTATQLAQMALNDKTKAAANSIAIELQEIRDRLNARYPEYKGKLGLRVISWLRAKQWELMRGRSGNSAHVEGHAVDFIITGAKDQEETNRLMNEVFEDLQSWDGGLAIKKTGERISFIHIDLGEKRRWKY